MECSSASLHHLLRFPNFKVKFGGFRFYCPDMSCSSPHGAQARARKKKEKEQKKLAEKLAIEDGAVGVESWILTHFDHDHGAFLIELCGR